MTMNARDFQQALLDRGYDLGPDGADGDIGPLTIAATAAFQKSIGLTGTGVPGPLTFEALLKPVEQIRQSPDPKSLYAGPLWLTIAATQVGVHEGVGAANNPVVLKMFADAGFPGIKSDDTAWCAAFVGAMLKRGGQPPSGSLMARSYEKWGVGLKEPALGCVATKKRGNSTWQGHVFFVVGASKTSLFGLGGNQDDSINVSTFPRSEITSLRWPAGVPIPTAGALPTTIAGAKKAAREA